MFSFILGYFLIYISFFEIYLNTNEYKQKLMKLKLGQYSVDSPCLSEDYRPGILIKLIVINI